ncbi:MAG: FAD-dependent oxidoreductase [Phycisphaerae bacterium]
MADNSNSPHYFLPQWISADARTLEADICVYGGTAAGVIAAATAADRGKRVVLLQPGSHWGGMTTGGLGFTDYGDKRVIGGRAHRFYAELGSLHGREVEWSFEPSAATTVLTGYLDHANIQSLRFQYLQHAEVAEGRIRSLRLLGGLRVKAAMFIDATYEGDLLALAGVSYTAGREPNSLYGETINGVQVREKHQFSTRVDPYVVPGDPGSGTLPGVNEFDAAPDGSGDGKLQAYNFRVCMTDDPKLRIAWAKPAGYDPGQYELARRWFHSEKDPFNEPLRPDSHIARKFDVLTQRTADGYHKTDTNNHGAVSSDFIGANYAWPEISYADRERMFQAHVQYQQGLYYFFANDPGMPERYREAYAQWGLAGDEFTDTGHWPHQLYIREARRMVSDYVLTEHDTQHHRQVDDAVGKGSYTMDSHNCQRVVRYIDGEPWTLNEGDVQLRPKAAYAISYRSIVPRKGECENLLVPVCLAASHIAFGSIRMEPVFMVLAESAAIAATLALDNRCAVQALPYEDLRPEVAAAGQVV